MLPSMLPEIAAENLVATDIQNQLLFKITTDIRADVEQIRLEKFRSQGKYRFPAVMEAVNIHKNAAKFGYNPRDPDKVRVLCPCCDLNINTEPIELCYETTFVPESALESDSIDYKFTSSVALFFTFIKMVIIYLLFRSIITDGFNFSSSWIAGTYCDQSPASCQSNFFTKSSGLNKVNRSDLVLVLDILNLVTVVLSIVFFLIFRRFQYKIYDIVDREAQTEDDYTLFIEDIPILDFPEIRTKSEIQFYYRKHLETIFTQKIQNWLQDRQRFASGSYSPTSIERELANTTTQHFSSKIITSISLCFDITELKRINLIKEDLMNKHEANPKGEEESHQVSDDYIHMLVQSSYQKIPNQIEFLNQSQIAICKKYAVDNSVMFNVTHFVGKAFISFQYQHYRQYITRQTTRDKNFLLFNRQPLKIQKAANPKDIFWANMNITNSSRNRRMVISFSIMIMTLVIVFGIFLSLDVLRRQSPSQRKAEMIRSGVQVESTEGTAWWFDMIFDYSSAIFITLFTMLVNDILWRATLALTDYQKHKTRTVHIFSLIVKVLITQFINTAIMMFFVTIIYNVKLLSSVGLVVQMSSMVIVGGSTGLITNALGLQFIQRRLWLWWYYRGKSQHDTVDKFQLRLNKEHEYLGFDLSGRYVYYLMQTYLASFYSYITPACIPVLAFIFAVQYWIDKFILLRLSSLKYNLEFYLSRVVVKLFQLSLVLFTSGNLIFSFLTAGRRIPIINIVAWVVSVVFASIVMFGTEDLQRRLFGAYQTFQEPTYSSCVKAGKFAETYWNQNPASSLVEERDVTGHANQTEKNPILIYRYGKMNAQGQQIVEQALERKELYDKWFHKLF